MSFHIGQKVVCIKRDAWGGGNAFGDECFPRFGEIYTVRFVDQESGVSWIRLEEIVNPLHPYIGDLTEASFRSDRFRPIVSTKTDISIFTRMLTDQKIGVDA